MFSLLPVIFCLQNFCIIKITLSFNFPLYKWCVCSVNCVIMHICIYITMDFSHWKFAVFFYRGSLLTAENYPVANCLRQQKGWQVTKCSSPLVCVAVCYCSCVALKWGLSYGLSHWVNVELSPSSQH